MQPQVRDNRIQKRDLGSFTVKGTRLVVNLQPGVPRNACIEEVDGVLRCWASREPLDQEAADYVRENAIYRPENNTFVWKDGVMAWEVRKG